MFSRIPAAWMLLFLLLTTGFIDSATSWMNSADKGCCSATQGSVCQHHGSVRSRVAHQYGFCAHDKKQLMPETTSSTTGVSITNNCSCGLEQRPSSSFPRSVSYQFLKDEHPISSTQISATQLIITAYQSVFAENDLAPEYPPPEFLS